MKLEEYKALLDSPNGNQYLNVHFQRFIETKRLAYQSWQWKSATILDIGAHWLHQSVLYALDGHRVIAADFDTTLNVSSSKKLASRHEIEPLVFNDLDSESVFDELPESSVDVVLFCEILEHLTFNPRAMWRAIYRVMKPGGRIILTTPNYYSLTNLLRSGPRFLTGQGGGLSVAKLLMAPTHSPHWKEFSRREVKAYFETLSPDFLVKRIKYHSFRLSGKSGPWIFRVLKSTSECLPFLRDGLYAEVDLPTKWHGVSVETQY